MTPSAIRLALAPVALCAATAFGGVDAEVGNGDKISGTISPAAEVETFRVRVPEGAKITVKAKAAKKGPALHVVLAPPSVAELVADGRSASIVLVAPASGLYSVTVTSQDGTSTGDYALSISWKSRTAFSATTVLAPAAKSTLAFAADRGGSASVATKPAKRSAADGVVDSVTLPNVTDVVVGQPTAKLSLALAGDYVVTFGNDGAAEGGVTVSVKIKLPKLSRRKVNLTTKLTGSGNPFGDAAIAAIFDAFGGTLTVPYIPPGEPGSEISGSSVTVPQGALGVATTILIATAPPLGVPDSSLEGAGPTVLFGPEALKFDKLDPDLKATVTIPFDPAFDDATDTFVIYTRDAKGKITSVPKPYAFDLDAHTVSFATSHFSSFRAGGKPPPPPLTLSTLATTDTPRDVCLAFDSSASLPLRYYVANSIENVVTALRTSASSVPPVTLELYAGGGTDPAAGSPRLFFKFVDPVQSVFATQSGQLFIATTHQIFTIDGVGNVQVAAGTGQSGDTGDGGSAYAATFTYITSILVAPDGRIYVADSGARRIRIIDPQSNNRIDPWAGTGVQAVGADGVDILQTTFVGPSDMAFDTAAGGGLYVADSGRVRQMRPGSIVAGGGLNTTIAGDVGGQLASTGDGGPLLAARFTSLAGIALYADPFHPSDTVLLVSDGLDHTIRKLDLTTDKVTLVAGRHGQFGFGGDPDVSTGLLSTPQGFVVEGSDITFADYGNSRIRVQKLLR